MRGFRGAQGPLSQLVSYFGFGNFLYFSVLKVVVTKRLLHRITFLFRNRNGAVLSKDGAS